MLQNTKMKKAQAAMEFLMTYGWAILVVLVVIGALAYFGILKPETSLPDRCELQQGFYCQDFRITDMPDGQAESIRFTFQNGRGTGMMVERVIVAGTGELEHVTCDTGGDLMNLSWATRKGLHIENGQSAAIEVPCGVNVFNNLPGSGKKKFDISIIWFDASSTDDYNHTMNGQLLAGVELQ
jgi:hypothetical protein